MSNFGSDGQLWRVAAVRRVNESVQAGPLSEVAPSLSAQKLQLYGKLSFEEEA